MSSDQSSTFRGSIKPPVYRILLALADDQMHGYAIMRSLSEKSEGRERLLPGTLYGYIARMVKDGLVEEIEAPDGEASGGPRRRYYRRSALGREAARTESERLRVLLDIAADQDLLPGIA